MYVAAMLMPAGKTDTRSALRTPTGLSSRHSPGKLIDWMEGVFPMHGPACQPTPKAVNGVS